MFLIILTGLPLLCQNGEQMALHPRLDEEPPWEAADDDHPWWIYTKQFRILTLRKKSWSVLSLPSKICSEQQVAGFPLCRKAEHGGEGSLWARTTPGGRGENEKVLGRPPQRQAPGDIWLPRLIRLRVLARHHANNLCRFYPPNQSLIVDLNKFGKAPVQLIRLSRPTE
jgi:hypothetical protein